MALILEKWITQMNCSLIVVTVQRNHLFEFYSFHLMCDFLYFDCVYVVERLFILTLVYIQIHYEISSRTKNDEVNKNDTIFDCVQLRYCQKNGNFITLSHLILYIRHLTVVPVKKDREMAEEIVFYSM